jgi:hypothetical protein
MYSKGSTYLDLLLFTEAAISLCLYTTAACYHAVHQQTAEEASSSQRMLLNILAYCKPFSLF